MRTRREAMRSQIVGVAGVRTVAHGFEPWEIGAREDVSALQRAKESSLSPAKAGSQILGLDCSHG
jgi:hypothetical protein